MEESLEVIESIPERIDAEIEGSRSVPDELPFVDEEDDEELLSFHFDIAMAVMDEDEEAIGNVFVEAVTEIVGGKTFPCENCDKICKSKAGLTRHVKAKHGSKANANIPSLTNDELTSIVNKVKANLTSECYWDTEITSDLAKVTSNENLFKAVSAMYQRFCMKRNQDNFLMEFYELIPKSTALLKCENQPLCSLVMISIPDHLVALFKSSYGKQKSCPPGESSDPKHETALSEHEHGPLSYIAGYVLAKLQKQCSSKPNEDLQVILQSMKRPSVENTYIDTRSRGGLVAPCTDLVQILETVEIVFRQFIAKQTTVVSAIPCDTLCNEALESPLIKSLWENILQECKDLPKQTTKLCLENIVKLYIKVRSFSYARDYINKFKIKQKAAKSKGLRKELKRHNVDM